MDYLDSWPRVQSFYSRPYSIESIEQFARSRPSLEPDHRRRLCAVLADQQTVFGGSQRGVEKLAAGAVAVVTGQQPVLFTGPLFSVFKAVSAIKLAQKLEDAGIKAVPVFWVAAEDHDYAELESTWVLNRNSELSRIAVDLSGTDPAPAGWLEFKEDVLGAVSECLARLPQSEFLPELQAILESSYKPGVSPVRAFACMMASLFRNTELTLVDPLHSELKAIAQPVVTAAIRKNSEMRSALMSRNAELSAAGYHEQVKVDQNFTGLFGYQGRARKVLRPDQLGNGIAWSPNVLMRPLVQDALLPTVTYIAGPAEIAYFAQAAAIYKTLDRPMPPIFPRISATLIEPRIARIMEKYSLGVEDVFQGRDSLRRKLVSASEDDQNFTRVKANLEAQFESLRPTLAAADETLSGALDTARQKVLHQLDSLHGKYVHAVARRNETLERHLDAMCNSLFPEKKQQERVLNISSFIARYGLESIPRLLNSLSLDSREHQVVEL